MRGPWNLTRALPFTKRPKSNYQGCLTVCQLDPELCSPQVSPELCISSWPLTVPPTMVSHTQPCRQVTSWVLDPGNCGSPQKPGRTGSMLHSVSRLNGKAELCKLLALQDLNFHLCSPRGTPSPRRVKRFPRVCQGRSYLQQKFTSHPAYFLSRLVRVMGKGFVEWGKLTFFVLF